MFLLFSMPFTLRIRFRASPVSAPHPNSDIHGTNEFPPPNSAGVLREPKYYETRGLGCPKDSRDDVVVVCVNEFSGRKMRQADRRSGTRFPLRLSCRVEFPFKSQCNFEGISENLSRDSVLIRVPEGRVLKSALRVGDWVRILLDLPHAPNLPARCLGCEATLARIADGGPDSVFLAFQIDQMEFCDRQDNGANRSASVPQAAVSGSVN